jgi:aryl-alcohol dehydrogenase-like predicted oxidoreductase
MGAARTGHGRVARLTGSGTSSTGCWGASPAESEAILDEYLDRGGNFVDTANIYTNGHS